MSRVQNPKRGVALGAIFALIGSFFAGAMPANAAPSTEAFFITPVSGTSYNTLVDEDFGILVVRNPAVLDSTDLGQLKYSITTNRTATSFSMELRAATFSGTAAVASASNAAILGGQQIFYNGNAITAAGTGITSATTEIPAFVTSSGVSVAATHAFVVRPHEISSTVSNELSIVFGSTGETKLNSISPTINVTVTAFIDSNGNDIFDAASEVSTTVTINYLKYSAVGVTTTTRTIAEGGVYATTSATIPNLNLNQVDGKWAVRVSQWNADGQITATSYSQLAERTVTDASYAAGAFSNSQTITAAVAGHSISSQVVYIKNGSTLYSMVSNVLTENTDPEDVILFGASSTQTLAAAKATGFSVYGVEGNNVSRSSATQADVRPNTSYTLRVTVSAIAGGTTASIPVSVTFGGVTNLSTTKFASVNGGTADTSGTLSAVTVNTNASGIADFVISTTGFGTSDDLTATVNVPGASATTYTLNAVDVDWMVEVDSSIVATTPDTAVAIGATVYDQFGVASTRTDQRIKFSWASGYSGTATNSFVVLSSGAASALMTPSRVPSTGSGTVTVQLQSYDSNLALWSDVSGDADVVTVTVTNNAVAFRTGLAASYSASISYGTDYSWSSVINEAFVLVTGSAVVVSGTGLIFKADSKIAADSIAIPSNPTGEVSFQVTARMAGTYTVTLTTGASSTTSLIVVNPARDNDGKSIEFDTSNIVPGKTKIVTGTVHDLNGNPVDTTLGDATIVVTYTGTAGIPVGSMPTETDANGNFQVSLLTSATDAGSFTLTAVYLKSGTSTATADKVTKVHAITVGASADAADQKITVGTFKGYVAIYTKGYMGQKLSAKVAGKWLVVDPVASWQGNDYSRTVRLTGAGYTIKVDLYIDGVFVRTETVVTK